MKNTHTQTHIHNTYNYYICDLLSRAYVQRIMQIWKIAENKSISGDAIDIGAEMIEMRTRYPKSHTNTIHTIYTSTHWDSSQPEFTGDTHTESSRERFGWCIMRITVIAKSMQNSQIPCACVTHPQIISSANVLARVRSYLVCVRLFHFLNAIKAHAFATAALDGTCFFELTAVSQFTESQRYAVQQHSNNGSIVDFGSENQRNSPGKFRNND